MTENQNKARRYLKSVAFLPQSIRAKILELEAVRAAAEGIKGISYDKDRVQTSPRDSMSETIIRMIDMIERLDQECTELREKRNECDCLLEQIDPEEANVIREHFFNFKSFYQIANIVHLSERSVRRRYDSALEKIGALL